MQFETLESRQFMSASLLKDISNPGWSDPKQFVSLGNGKAVFTAETAAAGRELWITDGTAAGTKPVVDLNPGWVSGVFADFKPIRSGAHVYFRAVTPDGVGLYRTDGTAAGTKAVHIEPGYYSEVHVAADVSGTLYFAAGSGVFRVNAAGGVERVEAVDGTDFNVWDLASFVNYNGKLAFVANDHEHGAEPWVADAAGARRLADVGPGVEAGLGFVVMTSYSARMTVVGSTLYFVADGDGDGVYELWRSNGTAAGTSRIAERSDLNVGWMPPMTTMGGSLYFVGLDGYNHAVKRYNPATNAFTTAYDPAGDAAAIDGIWAAGTRVYARFNDAAIGVTDGTLAGSRTLALPEYFGGEALAADGRLLFATTNSIMATNAEGTAVYRVAGPREGGHEMGGPREMMRLGDRLLFSAYTWAYDWEPWVAPLKARFTGTVFNDIDKDGVRDANEPGVGGRTVYIDANNNGRRDFGEATATTAPNGSYAFVASYSPGTYVVRQVLPTNWTQSTPKVNAGVTHFVNFGQGAKTADFGSWAKPASVSGFVFNDADRDGVRDTGEAGIASRRVYIDKDNDRLFDAGETSVWTTSTGAFTFANLAAGVTYRFRQVLPVGWTQSSPAANAARELFLSAGQAAVGVLFGSRRI